MKAVAYNVLQSNKKRTTICIFERLQMIIYIDDHEAWKKFCSMNAEFMHDIQHQIQSNYRIPQ